MSYEITLRDEKAVKAMTKRFRTSMENVSRDISQAFSDIWEHIQKNGGHPADVFFVLYHDEEPDASSMDAEAGISVWELVADGGGITGRAVDGGKHAVTLHKGSYGGLPAAYDALGKWVEENGYSVSTPLREIYLNDPSRVKPEELLTEVLWPVSK